MLTLRLELNQLHTWILRPASVDTVLEVTKPRRCTPRPNLLDSGIIVAGGDCLAGNGDPVLVAGVLERNSTLLSLFKVSKLFAVGIGKEQEVWSSTLCYGH